MLELNLQQPHVMTILNVTPDSFFEASRTFVDRTIHQRVEQAIREGASIIDVGGYSSRPGADDIDIEEEWQRVKRGAAGVREVSPHMPISVDTFRSEVVRRTVETFGRVVVNDIMAGGGSEDMYRVVAAHDLPYIAMHSRGTPQSMQSMTEYADVVGDVANFFNERIEAMQAAGIASNRIILDPGFGFAKSVEQNYQLLRGLKELCDMGYPMLVGVSRKSMIYKVLETDPSQALEGTMALNWEALRCGAKILRVHDTQAASQCIKLWRAYEGK
ncbi:MAG: dihydropteroate synthase [Rikenellaceae bacterium]